LDGSRRNGGWAGETAGQTGSELTTKRLCLFEIRELVLVRQAYPVPAPDKLCCKMQRSQEFVGSVSLVGLAKMQTPKRATYKLSEMRKQNLAFVCRSTQKFTQVETTCNSWQTASRFAF
jgi:hypothetical protein